MPGGAIDDRHTALEARKDDIGALTRTGDIPGRVSQWLRQTQACMQPAADLQDLIDKAIRKHEASRMHSRKGIAQLDVALEEMAVGNLDFRLDQPFGSALDRRT